MTYEEYQELIEKPLADFSMKLSDKQRVELYSICEDIKDKVIPKKKYD